MSPPCLESLCGTPASEIVGPDGHGMYLSACNLFYLTHIFKVQPSDRLGWDSLPPKAEQWSTLWM